VIKPFEKERRMKIRLCALGFAALLLTGTWAKAQTLAPAARPADSGAAPFCAASVAGLDKSLDLTPRPLFKATFTCGSCSSSSCVGAAVNSTCSYFGAGGYHTGKCVVGSVCSDNSSRCGCTNNPPV
jgi:hypothetical protein